MSNNVVSVCGILLRKIEAAPPQELTTNGATTSVQDNLVVVPSTQANLHRLALAVASDEPVLLVGPVGSGKTTLVEYLAAITGRAKAPHLMKIQIGDQTDSKVRI